MQARHAESSTLNRTTSPGQTKTRTESKPQERTKERRPKQAAQKPIEFTLNAPQANSVVVAGSFNNWDARKTPMEREGDGWKVRLPLAPGRYEYRFVVDGQWITDPNCKETVRNDYGSTNSILVV